MSFTVAGGVPAKPALYDPEGAGVGATPTYRWSDLSGATWYQLWVNDTTGTPLQKWYQVGSSNVSCSSGTCTVSPSTAITDNATWWVRGWNSSGNGLWSASKNFSP